MTGWILIYDRILCGVQSLKIKNWKNRKEKNLYESDLNLNGKTDTECIFENYYRGYESLTMRN